MSYISEVLADNPRVFWPLNEASGTDVLDLRGQFLPVVTTGDYVGSPTLAGPALIATGAAVETTTSSYVQLPTPPSMGVQFSVELWFEYVSGTAPIWRDETSTNGWYLDLSGTNPVVGTGDPSHTVHTVTTVTSSSLKDSARHHAVLTGDGSNFRLYLDGDQVDFWPGGLLFPFADTILLGKDGANSGTVDAHYAAVAIYGSTLSAARVAAHYAAADDGEIGIALATATALPLTASSPGVAAVSVTALQIAASAPVVSGSFLKLVSSTEDATVSPLATPGVDVADIVVVSPSVPTPTLDDGRPV